MPSSQNVRFPRRCPGQSRAALSRAPRLPRISQAPRNSGMAPAAADLGPAAWVPACARRRSAGTARYRRPPQCADCERDVPTHQQVSGHSAHHFIQTLGAPTCLNERSSVVVPVRMVWTDVASPAKPGLAIAERCTRTVPAMSVVAATSLPNPLVSGLPLLAEPSAVLVLRCAYSKSCMSPSERSIVHWL